MIKVDYIKISVLYLNDENALSLRLNAVVSRRRRATADFELTRVIKSYWHNRKADESMKNEDKAFGAFVFSQHSIN